MAGEAPSLPSATSPCLARSLRVQRPADPLCAPAVEKAVHVDALLGVMHTVYFPFARTSGSLTQRIPAKSGGVFGSRGQGRRGRRGR